MKEENCRTTQIRKKNKKKRDTIQLMNMLTKKGGFLEGFSTIEMLMTAF